MWAYLGNPVITGHGVALRPQVPKLHFLRFVHRHLFATVSTMFEPSSSEVTFSLAHSYIFYEVCGLEDQGEATDLLLKVQKERDWCVSMHD